MPLLKIQKMNTRRLHNSGLKQLARVLRGMSSSDSLKEAYVNRVKESIKRLPGRLRSSALSGSHGLCSVHKGLDSHLLNDIWAWVRHEFGATGRLLYPLFMEKKLDSAEELKLRQLEPVLQMWRTDFDLSLSAPPDLEPIDKGGKWRYQSSQCPACMLARIGSDQDVLFALFAGMIGRFPMYKLTSRKVTLAEFGVRNLKDVKSKRVRFVRYWIQASRGGDALLLEAANLGINLKKLYKEWKEMQGGESASLYRERHSHDNSTIRGSMEESRPLLATSPRISIRTTTHTRNDSMLSKPITLDPKIGPEPRPKEYVPHSPLELLGFNMTGYHSRNSNESSRPLLDPNFGPETLSHDYDTASTVFPGDSVSVAPLRINKVKQPERLRSQGPSFPCQGMYDAPVKDFPPHRRHDSSFDVLEPLAERESKPSNPPSTAWRPYAPQAPPSTASTSSSIETSKSYHLSPFSNYASTATSYSRVEMAPPLPPKNPFRDHSASKHIPVPKRQSMYFGYDTGDVGHDPFEAVDEPLPEDEGGGEGEGEEYEDRVAAEDGQVSDADTHWSDLY